MLVWGDKIVCEYLYTSFLQFIVVVRVLKFVDIVFLLASVNNDMLIRRSK